jgi:hypothetical protein
MPLFLIDIVFYILQKKEEKKVEYGQYQSQKQKGM